MPPAKRNPVNRAERRLSLLSKRRQSRVTIGNDVIELFDAEAEEKGVRLELVTMPHAYVLGDRDLLFETVCNLVDNAIKHGIAGGRVIVEASKQNAVAILSVEDDGPGIPAVERQNIFKRFYRLERSRSAPGNGLGLSLVAAVASLHGARIELIDAAPGVRFELWFPPALRIPSQTLLRPEELNQ